MLILDPYGSEVLAGHLHLRYLLRSHDLPEINASLLQPGEGDLPVLRNEGRKHLLETVSDDNRKVLWISAETAGQWLWREHPAAVTAGTANTAQCDSGTAAEQGQLHSVKTNSSSTGRALNTFSAQQSRQEQQGPLYLSVNDVSDVARREQWHPHVLQQLRQRRLSLLLGVLHPVYHCLEHRLL